MPRFSRSCSSVFNHWVDEGECAGAWDTGENGRYLGFSKDLVFLFFASFFSLSFGYLCMVPDGSPGSVAVSLMLFSC